ncbi:FAD-dependent oxidoreductase, partial [Pantoea agglomerans]|uniref:FAD-dependent oxidoreductase n=1 Tax=Enterobacter agglomerans TaxID=549 RepID=UPI003BA00ECF
MNRPAPVNRREGLLMSQQQIVIIGGGFTGTALAIHLARAGQAGLHVTVIEPR